MCSNILRDCATWVRLQTSCPCPTAWLRPRLNYALLACARRGVPRPCGGDGAPNSWADTVILDPVPALGSSCSAQHSIRLFDGTASCWNAARRSERWPLMAGVGLSECCEKADLGSVCQVCGGPSQGQAWQCLIYTHSRQDRLCHRNNNASRESQSKRQRVAPTRTNGAHTVKVIKQSPPKYCVIRKYIIYAVTYT